MANTKIDIVGPGELALIADLYNQVFKPPRDMASFQRRFLGRHNTLMMVAHIDDRPVGFFIGFELKPSVFFTWLVGTLPDYRRQGVASQLMEAAQAWAKHHEYVSMRLECHNQHRPMLHLGITQLYDIVGMRWDPDRGDNLVIFEKVLGE
ncbi:MAG: GNAT family N-acetyltransferase [Phycisphaera sp.]|nr:GNAT family N-acetyltransferase [Phycisphaera sp.]